MESHAAKRPLEEDTKQPTRLPHVRVGVGCILRRPDGKVLLGERLGSHGAGRMALPGGHLEHGESFEATAIREVAEETGIDITGEVRHVATTNDIMTQEGKHYVTVFMLADVPQDAEARNLEPHKCKGWSWVSWQDIREIPASRCFLPLTNLIQGKAFETSHYKGVPQQR
ncbi:unnamed protein product [Prorocentrum cordatum]|uniref:Nudix hydrolase domain-containing protein n=1 Tax=Prorocentrum cordatum TaxID=2364126 RepID=A0ABN9USD1_9DINO|nr:unnamed protein product [Polarella glacialis]CAK0891923.1 unnamed protein product [Polarella glacialis]